MMIFQSEINNLSVVAILAFVASAKEAAKEVEVQVLSRHATPALRYKQIRRNKTSSGNCMPM